MANIFKNKRILVTGGVGSIGSEIVKQLLKYNPAQIRIYDNRETETFHMQHMLSSHSNLRFLIGDIRDKPRLSMAMENVDIVFHAAALKHVPLCEYNPFEAVKTNVEGTQNMIVTALENNVERVINISTDKVTNPINAMGSTKLLAERLVSSAELFKGRKRTLFSSVRFGNVIDSRGSIVDLFHKQIKNEKPVTITNPDMTRYVMSVHQAVKLVLDSAEEMYGGEVFILKMPIFKLCDLVDVIIEEIAPKYGYSPSDIKKVIVGSRPGEKLYEELMTKEEAEYAYETKTKFIIFSPTMRQFYAATKRVYPSAVKTTKTKYSSSDAIPLSKSALRQILLTERCFEKIN